MAGEGAAKALVVAEGRLVPSEARAWQTVWGPVSAAPPAPMGNGDGISRAGE